MKKEKGVVISFAGIDGTGKTTQANLAADYIETCLEREVVRSSAISDHCTKIGGMIGKIMREPNQMIHEETECLLMLAARAQTHAEVIMPALYRGAVVISDRFRSCLAIYQDIDFAVANRRLMEFGLNREADLEFILHHPDPKAIMKRLDPKGNRLEQRRA